MSTTNTNRIAPDQRANITTPELLALYSRLEAVTAQRDQCREVLASVVKNNPTYSAWLHGSRDRAQRGAQYTRPTKESVANAYDAILSAARAALRACDEKRSAEADHRAADPHCTCNDCMAHEIGGAS